MMKRPRLTLTPIRTISAALLGGAVLVGASLPSVSASQSGSAEEMANEERYQLKRDGDHFVRLDKKTGEMSLCKIHGDNMVCRMAADDRNALEAEVEDLQDRLARLEEKTGDKTARRDKPKGDYPLEDEFEQAMDYSTRVIRRFYDVMKDIREDLNSN